jgi:protein-tyrosine kinase
VSRSFDVLHQENLRAAKLRPSAVPNPSTRAPLAEPDVQADAAREIANLVRRVFLLQTAAPPPKIVAFCAIEVGAGCSWVCARAAQSLASQVGGRVCIVDANLNAPSVHEQLHLANQTGFSESLVESRPMSEFARPARTERLWAITGGITASEAISSLSPRRLRSQFADLRQEFDYVLVDTPAMMLRSDAEIFGQVADGVVLVIGASTTRREPARIAKESLMAAGIQVLGAVLNRRTFPIPAAIYQRL